MRFRNHEDNERLIKRLENAVRDNRISHAYIFEGDSCIDKKSFAEKRNGRFGDEDEFLGNVRSNG